MQLDSQLWRILRLPAMLIDAWCVRGARLARHMHHEYPEMYYQPDSPMLRPSLIAYRPERAIVANMPLNLSGKVLFSSLQSVEMSAEETSSPVLLRFLNILDFASESCQITENRALGCIQGRVDIADQRSNPCQLLLQGFNRPLLLTGSLLELTLTVFQIPEPGN